METMNFESLAGWGEQQARSIPITGTVSGKKTAKALSRAMQQVADLAQGDQAPAWYADNGYLVRREGQLALRSFRAAGRLRKSGDQAAVVALCRGMVEAGPITEERVEAFLTGARRQETLPETEAALVADGLRVAVILALAEGAQLPLVGQLFSDLRTLAELDLTQAMERSDPVDALLRQDEVYPKLDEASRAQYRRQCQALGKKNGCSALKQAQSALDAGLHESLFPPRERQGWGYILAHGLVTLALALVLGLVSGRAWVSLAALLPLSEVSGRLINGLLLGVVRPRRLLRLACDEGIGPEGRTVCALSALLTDEKTGPALARRLEEYYLCNRDCGPDLLFALLADVPDSRTYPAPGSAAALEAARRAIEELNRRYGGGFYLLTRDSVWNRADGRYGPWERKRGAVLELCRLISGEKSALRCLAGERAALHGVYVLCLDSDTRLTPGSARQLIGAALHPLNQPVVAHGMVVRGHGILHPRMSLELDSALATDFARLYGGQGGTDPYGAPAGELFTDLLDRGGFAGKGLIHAQSYLQCLDGVLPENTVLSHDALEGAYLRGAYMGDVELTDTAPTTPGAWFRRLHRWVRGDWQNLPWVGPRGKGLAPIERWRLWDSVRRSLVPPTALLCLVLWFFVPGWKAAGAAALLCLGAEAVQAACGGLFIPVSDAALRCRSGVLRGLGGALTRFLARLLLLPWEAFTCAGAAITALWRMTVSHKNMLQWVTAAQSDRKKSGSVELILSVLLGFMLVVGNTSVGGKTVGLVWILLPLFSWVLALPRGTKNDLTDKDREFLRSSAEAAWGYFAQLCTRQDHWLPPDNIQIQPPKGLARRTSPTNIGLALWS
jgi:cyclic beta-1,2-glucan synthetase